MSGPGPKWGTGGSGRSRDGGAAGPAIDVPQRPARLGGRALPADAARAGAVATRVGAHSGAVARRAARSRDRGQFREQRGRGLFLQPRRRPGQTRRDRTLRRPDTAAGGERQRWHRRARGLFPHPNRFAPPDVELAVRVPRPPPPPPRAPAERLHPPARHRAPTDIPADVAAAPTSPVPELLDQYTRLRSPSKSLTVPVAMPPSAPSTACVSGH